METPDTKKSQLDRFKGAAPRLEADDDGAKFNDRLGKMAVLRRACDHGNSKGMGTSTLNVRIRRAEGLVRKLEAALADPNLSTARRETAQLALRGAQHLLDKRKAQQRAISAAPGERLHPR